MKSHRDPEIWRRASPLLKRQQNYSPGVIMVSKTKGLDQMRLSLRLKQWPLQSVVVMPMLCKASVCTVALERTHECPGSTHYPETGARTGWYPAITRGI